MVEVSDGGVASERGALLRQVWGVLARHPSVLEVLRAVTARATAVLGDSALVRLLSEDGTWARTVTVRHVDPHAEGDAWALLDSTAQRLDEWQTWRVVADGTVARFGPIDMGALRAHVPEGLAPYLERFPLESSVVAPLFAGGEPIGVLAVVRHSPDRPYVDADVELVRHLAREAGLAIENARLLDALGAEAAGRAVAERSLQGREAWWRALTERSSELVLVLTVEGVLTYVSPSVTRTLGWRPDDLVGRRAATLLHPDDVAAHPAPERAPLFADIDASARYRVRHADGSWRTIEFTASVRLDDPDIAGVIVNGRDVTDRVAMEDALRQSERHFRAVVRQASDVIVMLDARGRARYVSPAVERVLGYGPDDRVPDDLFSIVHPDDRAGVAADFVRKVEDPSYAKPVTFRIAHRAGGWRFVEAVGENLLDDPDLQAVLVTLRDVTARVAAEEALRASEAQYRRVVEVSPEAVVIHQDGSVAYANPAALRVLGADAAGDVVGRGVTEVFGNAGAGVAATAESLDPASARAHEARLVGVDGRSLDVELVAVATTWGGRPAVQVVARDITARKRSEAVLTHQATHDALTGLPNRALLLDRIAHAVSRSARSGRAFAVLFLDLDRFKAVNDALGHDAGDELLGVVAARLLEAVRPGDTVARFGGDEFVVLVEDLEDEDGAGVVADRIEEALARPVELRGRSLHVTASIGVVVAEDGAAPGELLRDADVAMYLAKDQGRARWVRATGEASDRAGHALEVEDAVGQAFERDR